VSLLETIRQVITPGASYPMVRLFPGGPIGNDVGLNPGAMPGGGAVPEPQVQANGQIGRGQVDQLPTPTGRTVAEPGHLPTAQLPTSPSASTGRVDTYLRGAVGAANFAGFIRDLGEYNPILEGRSAFLVYEKMWRSDADVRAALMACKLPIRAADFQIVPGLKENEPGFDLAKKIADEVRENLLGGLESPTNTSCWVTPNFETLKENAQLCLDFGCPVHEDLWHIDS